MAIGLIFFTLPTAVLIALAGVFGVEWRRGRDPMRAGLSSVGWLIGEQRNPEGIRGNHQFTKGATRGMLRKTNCKAGGDYAPVSGFKRSVHIVLIQRGRLRVKGNARTWPADGKIAPRGKLALANRNGDPHRFRIVKRFPGI